jgi:methyltransferase family protein
MLAKVAAHYGRGPVVAIDPHNSPILLEHSDAGASSYQEFLHSLRSNGVSDYVEPQVAYSTDVARSWNRPIRILWIDGDHTLKGAKDDLDAFLPFLVPNGVVAFHDALNQFPGPIRVFVEQVLASDRFGPSGFVHSIAWAQYRPVDGIEFRKRRSKLQRKAARLIPFVESGEELHGIRKKLYKLNRSRVPRSAVTAPEWCEGLRAR